MLLSEGVQTKHKKVGTNKLLMFLYLPCKLVVPRRELYGLVSLYILHAYAHSLISGTKSRIYTMCLIDQLAEKTSYLYFSSNKNMFYCSASSHMFQIVRIILQLQLVKGISFWRNGFLNNGNWTVRSAFE